MHRGDRIAFRDLGEGKAIAMPRMRYAIQSPDPERRYFANVHIGAVTSFGTASVRANRQIELLEPIEKGLVDKADIHTLGEILAGKARVRSTGDNIVYYKNNTGLAMQFAAAGAILYKKLSAEGTNRVIPREWLAGENYAHTS